MTGRALQLVLCWHMHQPQYRDPADGRYVKPWTWLHGIKDYADMAAHLETVPGARAVVNFSTVLLEQLADYAARIARWSESGEAIGDALLDALGGRPPASDAEKLELAGACLHAHKAHMIDAFPPYAALCSMAEDAIARAVPLDEAQLYDLLTWYHLAWTGESVRREQPLVRDLLRNSGGFTADDGKRLLELIGGVLGGLVPRYRRLAESGRVELSVTPHAHPILPLLIDPEVAHEAMPEAPLPTSQYPGGLERCRWHIERALTLFEGHFGFRPAGCWPSEGGISEAVVPLLDEAGFAWTATGTNVLRNSLGGGIDTAHLRHWQAARDRYGLAFFFRDDELSDRIGFQYSTWDAGHAVQDLIDRLEALRQDWKEPEPPVVSIIMDGENAWEHFPYNGWHFLQQLYARLAAHPHIELKTFGAVLDQQHSRTELPKLVAGSWVYGNFAVWIGDPHKNRAWERLSAAKAGVDRFLSSQQPIAATRDAVLEQLGVCEGSDWFWWLGAGNDPEESIAFDSLFRRHLKALYRLMGVPAPDDLDVCLEPDPAAGEGGAMRRADQ